MTASRTYATEVAPGIFAIGGTIPASRPTTWMMPGLSGHLAVSCYALRDGDDLFLIDAGLSVHRDAILAALDEAARGTSHREMIMSRREPDAIVNLPAAVDRLGIDTVYCGGAISPLDFFERVDEKNIEAHVYALSGRAVSWVRPGDTIRVGRMTVDVMPTRICVLPKNHFYERETRTLFGSDSWSFLGQDTASGLGVVRAIDERVSRRAVARYLGHRFDWLKGVDSTPVQEEIAGLADSIPIDRICSAYGAVVEGRDVVAHLLAETVEALRLLAAEPMVDLLAGFHGLAGSPGAARTAAG